MRRACLPCLNRVLGGRGPGPCAAAAALRRQAPARGGPGPSRSNASLQGAAQPLQLHGRGGRPLGPEAVPPR
eukprot:501145-Prymnesium_polylepis.1